MLRASSDVLSGGLVDGDKFDTSNPVDSIRLIAAALILCNIFAKSRRALALEVVFFFGERVGERIGRHGWTCIRPRTQRTREVRMSSAGFG